MTLRQGPAFRKRIPERRPAADIGLTRKDVHDAREIRDAEQAEPGHLTYLVTEFGKPFTPAGF